MIPEEIKEILIFLEKNRVPAYIVGGYVRDFVLNKKSYDIDVAAQASFEKLSILLEPFHPKVALQTFTFMKQDYFFQITPFRKENYDGIDRYPKEIVYTEKIDEDSERRDFTINALYMKVNGTIIDPQRGIMDLKKKKIRCIGNVDVRLKEDPLRILRAIRLASVLKFEIDSNLADGIKRNKHLLHHISFMRKKMELEKIYPQYVYLFSKYIEEYQLASFLEIERNLKPTPFIEGFWACFNIHKYPFSKKQKKKIKQIQFYIEKEIEKEDLIDCDLKQWETICILKGISFLKLKECYEKLPIHSICDIKMPYKQIKNHSISLIKKEVAHLIINGKLKNEETEILQYLTNTYNNL